MSNFQNPLLSWSIYIQSFSTPLALHVHFQANTPSLQMISNQFKENIIKRWLSYVIRSFFQVGFCFQYRRINLAWLSFDFFLFSWSLTIYFSVALNSCMCSCTKISQNVFYLYLFTFLLLILKLTCFFAHLENVNKLWNNNCTVHLNERPRVLLFDIARKQCNGIIKGWLHCLTSESKGRFLVTNILMFGSAWCLAMAQIQFSLMKE